MANIEVFEKYSAEYDKWFDLHQEEYNAEKATIKRLVPFSGSKKAVEIGVGSGRFALPLGIRIGVEPSKKMADIAFSKGIKVCCSVAENLPFRNDEFDLLLMVTTICFVNDVNKTFQEAYRVLKSKGTIIIGYVDKNSTLGKRYIKNRYKSKFYKNAVFFSTKEILGIFDKTGFFVEEIKQTLIPGKPKKIIMDGCGGGSFVAIKAVTKK